MSPELLDQARAERSFAYPDVRGLNYDEVDPEIRESIRQINASSWVATDGCCAGHAEARPPLKVPFADFPTVWLVFRHEDAPRLYKALHDACRAEVFDVKERISKTTARSVCFETQVHHYTREGFVRLCLKIYLSPELHDDEESRMFGRDVLSRFALLVLATDPVIVSFDKT